MDLGKRIKKLRIERGLTQADLAIPDYTAAYVCTIERGKRNPSNAALDYFAKKLHVPTEELLTGRSADLKARLLADYLEGRRLLASGRRDAADKAEHHLSRVAREAAAVGFIDIESKARYGIAFGKELRNDAPEALRLYDEIEHSLRDQSPLVRVDAVIGRARVLQLSGDGAYAAFLLEKALAELRWHNLEDPSALVRIHTSLVAAYFDRGLVDQAMASAEIAQALEPHVSDPERVANMNLNVALMLTEQGQFSEAEQHFVRAEYWFTQLQFQTDLARVQLARGLGLRNQGELHKARELLSTARTTFREAGDELDEARATGALAIAERLAGNLDQAKFLLRQSIELAKSDKGSQGIAYREIALCYGTSDVTKALKNLRQAIALLTDSEDARELAATYRVLGDILSEELELQDACDAYRTAARLLAEAA